MRRIEEANKFELVLGIKVLVAGRSPTK